VTALRSIKGKLLWSSIAEKNNDWRQTVYALTIKKSTTPQGRANQYKNQFNPNWPNDRPIGFLSID